MAFATLHEAWGVTSFEKKTPKPVVPQRKPFDKDAGRFKLSAPTPTPAQAAAVLRGILRAQGLPGLSRATGMQFVRDIVAAAAATPRRAPRAAAATRVFGLDAEAVLMVLIGLFSLVVMLDSM